MKINFSKKLVSVGLITAGGFVFLSGLAYAQEERAVPMRNRPIDRQVNTQSNRDINTEETTQRRAPERNINDSSALPPRSNMPVENQEKKELAAQNREERLKAKCEQVTQKISSHKNNFKLKSQKRLNKYTRVVERLESVSIKLSESGVDVTTYNTYITELKTKVTAFNGLINEYISSEVKNVCITEQPSSEIDSKKEALQVIIKTDKEIRMYIRDNILAYLRSIKPQETESSSEKEETSNTVDEGQTQSVPSTTPVEAQ